MLFNILNKTSKLTKFKINPNTIFGNIAYSHNHSKNNFTKLSNGKFDQELDIKVKNILYTELDKTKINLSELTNPETSELDSRIKLIIADELNKANLKSNQLKANTVSNKENILPNTNQKSQNTNETNQINPNPNPYKETIINIIGGTIILSAIFICVGAFNLFLFQIHPLLPLFFTIWLMIT